MADRNLLMMGYYPTDMDGYDENQAYAGRYRDPNYRSGAVEHAVGPVDFLTPMGIGAGVGGALGYGAGRLVGRAASGVADVMFPTLAAMSRLVGRQAPSQLPGVVGGGVGALMGAGSGANYAAWNRIRQFDDYMEPMLPPVPTYPRRSPY